MFLSVIIPAYNEENRASATLKKIKAYLEIQKYNWEVLFVNDGSTDRTAEVVGDLIKDWYGFRLIDNKENKGKGGVVKQGMLEAKGEWRLFMDADNSTDIKEIEKFTVNGSPITEFHPSQSTVNGERLADIFIGSRYLNKDSIKTKQPLIRQMISRVGNWLVRVLLGINMVDTQCGFKLFSAKAAQDIFPRQTIMRWGFDMEVLAISIRAGYKIKEVAVDWYDDDRSRVAKSQAIKTLKELFLIKKNLIKGLYDQKPQEGGNRIPK